MKNLTHPPQNAKTPAEAISELTDAELEAALEAGRSESALERWAWRTRLGLGWAGRLYSWLWNAAHRSELSITGRCSCHWCEIGFSKHTRWGQR